MSNERSMLPAATRPAGRAGLSRCEAAPAAPALALGLLLLLLL